MDPPVPRRSPASADLIAHERLVVDTARGASALGDTVLVRVRPGAENPGVMGVVAGGKQGRSVVVFAPPLHDTLYRDSALEVIPDAEVPTQLRMVLRGALSLFTARMTSEPGAQPSGAATTDRALLHTAVNAIAHLTHTVEALTRRVAALEMNARTRPA